MASGGRRLSARLMLRSDEVLAKNCFQDTGTITASSAPRLRPPPPALNVLPDRSRSHRFLQQPRIRAPNICRNATHSYGKPCDQHAIQVATIHCDVHVNKCICANRVHTHTVLTLSKAHSVPERLTLSNAFGVARKLLKFWNVTKQHLVSYRIFSTFCCFYCLTQAWGQPTKDCILYQLQGTRYTMQNENAVHVHVYHITHLWKQQKLKGRHTHNKK